MGEKIRYHRDREFALEADGLYEFIKGLFPDAAEKAFWEFKELQTPDGYLLQVGFDGASNEASVMIEHEDDIRDESIDYVIKSGSIKKQGSVRRKSIGAAKTVFYTDDEKRMESIDKKVRKADIRPALRIDLDELRIVARIAQDIEANAQFARLPTLRFPLS